MLLGAWLTGLLIIYLVVTEIHWAMTHPDREKGYGKRNSHRHDSK